jgi:peptidoglycan/LPS O-acetylase OafA/YrhL
MPKRFYSLDVLRGVAALGVVILHWRHFFDERSLVLEDLPLYAALKIFYTSGSAAVDLFFCLSGFIFHWLYAESISKRTISGREFFLLRFSRLYPLHFVTLLIVAMAQYIGWSNTGRFFAYEVNDGYHFVLQLLFASSVGLERGLSFNGPVWSVSVEVFLYIVFFIACWATPRRWLVIFLAMLSGLAIWPLYQAIARSMLLFFLGGAVFLIYRWSVQRKLNVWMPIVAVAAFAWAATIVNIYLDLVTLSRPAGLLWVDGFLFPTTVLALALAETARGTLWKRFAVLGDISYSTYLIHFPLQLLFVGGVALAGGSGQLYYSASMLILYLLTLMTLSIASYRYMERPLQQWLRASGNRMWAAA